MISLLRRYASAPLFLACWLLFHLARFVSGEDVNIGEVRFKDLSPDETLY